MTPVALQVREARKSFGALQVLRGLSLELRAGELLGLLGPNGAGKTTLIRCLAGRSKLDSGSIEFSPACEDELLGLVPQELAIYLDLTVEQNLQTFGRLHGVKGRELQQRVAEALEWSNLSARRGTLAKRLSGGMQRRLNIACSVLHRPGILLLDEPAVGVDPQSRERIYEMLAELRGQGAAILLTTHQLEEAQFRCDRIAIIDQGSVVGCGTFEELVRSTVGPDQHLTVSYRAPPASVPAGFQWDAGTQAARRRLDNAAGELPGQLAAIAAAGGEVGQIALQGPNLQHVFLHLTGKELRE